MRKFSAAGDTAMPSSMADLRAWIHERLHLQVDDEVALLAVCEALVKRERKNSKNLNSRAIRALASDFTTKVTALKHQISTERNTLHGIGAYFKDVVADLTEQSRRDPKTRLLQFPWFMDRLTWFLGFEQRLGWCAVGLVDIANFKSYNDTLGHMAGDEIIERVARILAEQIRSDDILAGASGPSGTRRDTDLHARFGGDEFSFLLPHVVTFTDACRIAQRFKTVVERYDWGVVNRSLKERPVRVDVGMACLHLGPLAERQLRAEALAAELIESADELMYAAKRARADRVRSVGLRLDGSRVVEVLSQDESDESDDGTSGSGSASV